MYIEALSQSARVEGRGWSAGPAGAVARWIIALPIVAARAWWAAANTPMVEDAEAERQALGM